MALQKTVADALKNYQEVLDTIFGAGECSVKQGIDEVHNVLGALNGPHFTRFSECFLNRLRRLEQTYHKGSIGRQKVTRLLQELTHPRNWGGHYSELLAIDYLNFHGIRKHFSNPVMLDNKLSANETWASSFPNRSEADLDGRFPELLDVYCDIKIFQDVASDFLSRMITDFQSKYPDANVLPQKPAWLSTELNHTVRAAVLAELESAASTQQTYVKSKVVDGLSFRLAWTRPFTLFNETIIEPYQMAERRHLSIFDYSDKFTKHAPFVLILVRPPWREQRLSNGANKPYYRALARRVFCQYRTSSLLHKDLFSEIQTSESLFDVSRSISAIAVLEDHSPECTEPDDQNVKAYCYLNPNALNTVNSLFRNYMREWNPEVLETFQYDNY